MDATRLVNVRCYYKDEIYTYVILIINYRIHDIVYRCIGDKDVLGDDGVYHLVIDKELVPHCNKVSDIDRFVEHCVQSKIVKKLIIDRYYNEKQSSRLSRQ